MISDLCCIVAPCFLFKKVFICLFLACWVFLAARRLSLVVASGQILALVLGLLIAVASLAAEPGP